MIPVTPIVPGLDLPVTEIAKNQPPYKPLPAFVDTDGTVLTRWRLTWRERLRVLLRGNVYLWIFTFRLPLQPVALDTQCQINRPTK